MLRKQHPLLALQIPAFFSSKIPTINGITSPSSISTVIAQQERNQFGHLIRRAPPLNAQPHAIDGSACGT